VDGGGNGGSFSYSYPIPAPPSPGGDAPSLAFTYDSGAVDGRTSASNSQASWVGLGWDLATPFIERSYKSCSDDGHSSWGDLCWDSPYSDKAQGAMTISLNGKTSELIWVGENRWRSASDDGWRITRQVDRDNGDEGVPGATGDRGESWLVQTPDGTRYYFGLGKQNQTGRATNSVASVPVFGDDSGEPTCSANEGDFCRQGYRWMLDHVVDSHKNATTYFYRKDLNRYAVHGTASKSVTYDRSIQLAQIEYGQRWGVDISDKPPAKIVFNAFMRCIEAVAVADPMNTTTPSCPTQSAKPESYPDVPTDLMCLDSCTSDQSSPVFFASQRLDDVRTYVLEDNGAYALVDRIQAKYSFPKPSDGTDPGLWLDFFQRRGYMGDDLTTPITRFDGTELKNRVDYKTSAGVLPMQMRRITTVVNDLGGKIRVTYGLSKADTRATARPTARVVQAGTVGMRALTVSKETGTRIPGTATTCSTTRTARAGPLPDTASSTSIWSRRSNWTTPLRPEPPPRRRRMSTTGTRPGPITTASCTPGARENKPGTSGVAMGR
jgi:hypothetical protein